MSRAISIPSSQPEQRKLNFDVWGTILEFSGACISAVLARTNKVARTRALLMYGFVNQDLSTGEISYVIDESYFPAAWYFLMLAERHIWSRTEDQEILDGRVQENLRKFPPILTITLGMHRVSSRIDSVEYQDKSLNIYRLMKKLISDSQLHIFRTDIVVDDNQSPLGEMIRNQEAVNILKELLTFGCARAGITSIQTWKSELMQEAQEIKLTYKSKKLIASIIGIASLALFSISLAGAIKTRLPYSYLSDVILCGLIPSIILIFAAMAFFCIPDRDFVYASYVFENKKQYDRADQMLRFFDSIANPVNHAVVNIDGENTEETRLLSTPPRTPVSEYRSI